MPSLHLLGTGAGLLNPERNASSYLLDLGDRDVLLDAGEPVSATLARRDFDWSRLHGIVITHTHADHCGGLPMLVQQLHLSGRTNPLDIYGPPEYVERLREHWGVHYLLHEAMKFEVRPHALEPGVPFELCGVSFLPSPTQHLQPAAGKVAEFGYPNRCEAFALRMQVDAVALFYSGDVGSFDDVRTQMDGCLLCVLDSTHVDLGDIMAWAADHPKTELILSHVVPGFDEQTLAADLRRRGVQNVALAVEGRVIAL